MGCFTGSLSGILRVKGTSGSPIGKHHIPIIIGDVISYPQDYAAGMTIYPEIKRHTNAWIIDIEGFSVAYLELKNGAPNKDVCDSKEHFYVQEKI
jgi:hypothetical protein